MRVKRNIQSGIKGWKSNMPRTIKTKNTTRTAIASFCLVSWACFGFLMLSSDPPWLTCWYCRSFYIKERIRIIMLEATQKKKKNQPKTNVKCQKKCNKIITPCHAWRYILIVPCAAWGDTHMWPSSKLHSYRMLVQGVHTFWWSGWSALSGLEQSASVLMQISWKTNNRTILTFLFITSNAIEEAHVIVKHVCSAGLSKELSTQPWSHSQKFCISLCL
jgi:hypothetical protein